MSSCKICGEAGHFASKCKELGIPPDELYTGPGAERGSEEEDSSAVYERMRLVQSGLLDDEILSTPQELVLSLSGFPSTLSNEVEEAT
jgi:hypothetical protein